MTLRDFFDYIAYLLHLPIGAQVGFVIMAAFAVAGARYITQRIENPLFSWSGFLILLAVTVTAWGRGEHPLPLLATAATVGVGMVLYRSIRR